ncbi:MAG: serine/threonine-protein kinase [Lachnospiraceae bacterium]|nr:serine/threonine-protein kinase [Lachnospiraceae bacterium]
MNINHFCMKCMEGTLNESGVCTSCGAKDSDNGNMHLPVRSILNGKYLVGNVIGEGGFGITYIGFDLALEIRVAIKEFCPKGLVGREAEDGMTLYPYNEDAEEAFEKEKNKVINEARRLAKFRNEKGVVSVRDFFVENGTAYIVMDYIEGMTLKKYLKTLKNSGDGCMSMEEVLKLFRPLMETLTKIHRENIIHRDISPDNIMISKDLKTVHLIDFGTARDTLDGHTMSIYSKSFYTPIEQDSEKMKQGPWTDVYALCATIYICITGRRMPLAGDRRREDDLVAPREYGVEISATMETTLLKGLAVYPENRIQSVEELMKAFYEESHADYEEASNPQPESQGEKTSEESKEEKEQKTESSPKAPVDPQKVAMERMKVKAQLRTIRNKQNIISCGYLVLGVLLWIFIGVYYR